MKITTSELDLEGQFDAQGVSLTTTETPKVDAGSNRLLGFSVTATAANGAVVVAAVVEERSDHAVRHASHQIR